jgi:hypothetical protein
MIVCSACGSQITQGATTCPHCKLPLTAQAVRVQRRRMSTFSFVALTFLGICITPILIGGLYESIFVKPKREAARSALLADLKSGKLDAQAFQTRCGKALTVSDREDAKILTYGRADLLVKLAPGQPAQFYAVRAHNHEAPVGANFALDHLDCDRGN